MPTIFFLLRLKLKDLFKLLLIMALFRSRNCQVLSTHVQNLLLRRAEKIPMVHFGNDQLYFPQVKSTDEKFRLFDACPVNAASF